PGLVWRGLPLPGRVPTSVALSGLLPAGRESLDAFLAPLVALSEPGAWAPHPATWVVAVDYGSGARTCFGAPGAPETGIREAVRASCTVPGVFPPVRIGDREYVDGGVHSATSVDLVIDQPLDEVIVLAPMAGQPRRPPRSPVQAADLVVRRLMHRRLAAECARVRRAGIRVRLLVPSTEDLAAMTGNPLDPRRRIGVFEAAMRSAPARIAAVLA
ncbi:MAG: patatin-like phospholipase family protein, partial [Micromonosporaceae bacterium]